MKGEHSTSLLSTKDLSLWAGARTHAHAQAHIRSFILSSLININQENNACYYIASLSRISLFRNEILKVISTNF